MCVAHSRHNMVRQSCEPRYLVDDALQMKYYRYQQFHMGVICSTSSRKCLPVSTANYSRVTLLALQYFVWSVDVQKSFQNVLPLRPKSTFDLLDKFGPSRERSLKQASDQSTYSYRMTWFQRGSHIAWCQREKGAPRSVNSCRRHHLRHTTPTCFILKIDRPWHQLTHHDIHHSSSPPRRWKKIGT